MHLTLAGELVRLEPLGPEHAADLVDAVGDRTTFGLASVPMPDEVDDDIERRRSAPDVTPFAQVRVADGRAVGVTCFLNHRRRSPDDDPYAVEITDARNERTRAAIERLGATFEGVLRRWQPSQKPGEEHLLRDTAMYAILADEWPAVKAALEG